MSHKTLSPLTLENKWSIPVLPKQRMQSLPSHEPQVSGEEGNADDANGEIAAEQMQPAWEAAVTPVSAPPPLTPKRNSMSALTRNFSSQIPMLPSSNLLLNTQGKGGVRVLTHHLLRLLVSDINKSSSFMGSRTWGVPEYRRMGHGGLDTWSRAVESYFAYQ